MGGIWDMGIGDWGLGIGDWRMGVDLLVFSFVSSFSFVSCLSSPRLG